MTRPLVALSLVLLGCPKGPDDTAADTQLPPEESCELGYLFEGTITIDPDGPLTQIHGAATWDGEAVWVAYNRPEESGKFDVYATRISTAGEVLVAPMQIDGGEGYNETYPRLASDGDNVVVAWQEDNGAAAANLSLMARRFAVDGSNPGEPTVIQPEVEGSEQQGNAWMPAIAAEDGGGYALAGAVALDSVSTFQAVMQPLAPSGLPTGEAWVPELDGEQSHYYPVIDAGPNGRRVMAWEAWTTAGTEIHVEVDGVLGAFGEHDDAGIPAVAWERGDTTQAYLAYHSVQGSEYDIVILGGDLTGSPASMTLGVPGEIDHSPVLAGGKWGGVVAWMRNVSGLNNELVVERLSLEAGQWVTVGEQVVDTETYVAPYLPGLTWLCDDAYFLSWVEGENPDYVVKGRFMRFGY